MEESGIDEGVVSLVSDYQFRVWRQHAIVSTTPYLSSDKKAWKFQLAQLLEPNDLA